MASNPVKAPNTMMGGANAGPVQRNYQTPAVLCLGAERADANEDQHLWFLAVLFADHFRGTAGEFRHRFSQVMEPKTGRPKDRVHAISFLAAGLSSTSIQATFKSSRTGRSSTTEQPRRTVAESNEIKA